MDGSSSQTPPLPLDPGTCDPPTATSLEQLQSGVHDLQDQTMALVPRREGGGLQRDEATRLVDSLLVRVARGRGALDLLIGADLAALTVGDRLLQLGYASLGDYAREALGLAERTAQEMVQLARQLSSRPHLEQAVWSGRVTARKARAILLVARGAEERKWTELACHVTVRGLQRLVTEHRGRTVDPEEQWETVYTALTPAQRERVNAALTLARRAIGGRPKRWECLQALCQQYMSDHPLYDDAPSSGHEVTVRPGRDQAPRAGDAAGAADAAPPTPRGPTSGLHGSTGPHDATAPHDATGPGASQHRRSKSTVGPTTARAHDPEPFPGAEPAPATHPPRPPGSTSLEDNLLWLHETDQRWSFLEAAPAVAATRAPPETAPHRLDDRLREHAVLRRSWDELVGRLALLVRMHGLWRDAEFDSFAMYCTERLGLSVRTVEERARLDERMLAFPELRQALRDGRLTYSKALQLGRVASAREIDDQIRWAQDHTCLQLRGAADRARDAQMCASGLLEVHAPATAISDRNLALQAARRVSLAFTGRWLSEGEAFFRVADHFVGIWKPLVPDQSPQRRRLDARTDGRCQVPVCSRAAGQDHHIRFRSHGGGEGDDNKVPLCAAHHLHCLHKGWMRVTGRADQDLLWELGLRDGVARERFRTFASEPPLPTSG